MRSRALDLFARAGGVSEGLLLAGFDVVAVDILDCSKAFNRGPGNPDRHERPAVFVQADALVFDLSGFDFVWASPPCQAYSSATRITGKPADHPDLVALTRARLARSGALWVVENVPGAPLRHGFTLCGSSFGLESGGRPLKRHRLFEPSWAVLAPPCQCDGRQKLGVYGHGGGTRVHKLDGYPRYAANVAEMREGLGIDWMRRDDLTQAIPPAYARWIGERALEEIRHRTKEAATFCPTSPNT